VHGRDEYLFRVSQPPAVTYGLVREAMLRLGWTIVADAAPVVSAKTSMSAMSFGEQVDVKVYDGYLVARSKGNSWQLYDWGKNKKNVEALVSALPPGLAVPAK